MNDYPAGSVEKNGVTVEIFVDGRGNWKADHGGQAMHADTRDKLVEKISRATKQTTVKIALPFVQAEDKNRAYATPGVRFKHGTATGLHSANGNVLVQWDNGTKEQLSHSYNITFFPALDVTLLEEFERLTVAKHAAARAHREFLAKYEINLKDTVFAEIAKNAQG